MTDEVLGICISKYKKEIDYKSDSLQMDIYSNQMIEKLYQ